VALAAPEPHVALACVKWLSGFDKNWNLNLHLIIITIELLYFSLCPYEIA